MPPGAWRSVPFLSESNMTLNTLPPGFCRAYTADVSCLADGALFARLYASVPDFRQGAVDQYRFDRDRRLSLGAWVLLQHAMREAGLDVQSLTFAVTDAGKPFVVGMPGVCFSLSHAGSRVMAVLSDTEVGCDVEVIGAGRLSVARRWFTDTENALLDAMPDENGKSVLFCRLWVLKESFLKVTGRGLALSMRDFSFAWPDSSADPVLTQHEDGYAYTCREYAPADGYRCAVVRRAGACPETLTQVDLTIM